MEQNDPTKEVKKLRVSVQELQWRSRRFNLDIHGIPRVENGNLLERVSEVAQKLRVPAVSGTEVIAMHRLLSNTNKTFRVIVKFSRQATRDH